MKSKDVHYQTISLHETALALITGSGRESGPGIVLSDLLYSLYKNVLCFFNHVHVHLDIVLFSFQSALQCNLQRFILITLNVQSATRHITVIPYELECVAKPNLMAARPLNWLKRWAYFSPVVAKVHVQRCFSSKQQHLNRLSSAVKSVIFISHACTHAQTVLTALFSWPWVIATVHFPFLSNLSIFSEQAKALYIFLDTIPSV